LRRNPTTRPQCGRLAWAAATKTRNSEWQI
jgi:hypothetical protein